MRQSASCRGRCRAALDGLRQQAAFTMVEVLVAMLLLLVGMLATFMLVGSANASMSSTRAREGATNLAREVIENAHDTAYSQLGQSAWFTPALQSLPGGSGVVTSPTANSLQTTITRRGVSYGVVVSWCSVDDTGDGYGAHGSSVTWCSDSQSTGSQDPQPEDFKRVTATVTWSFANIVQPTLLQTATFAATGAIAGPSVSGLSITSPSGVSSTAPVIASSSVSTVTFLGTSSGSADMRFFVNNTEQLTGVTNNGNGTWSFNWSISQLPDGTYTIAAVAVDALGNRGPPRTIQVKLARTAPAPPANVTGGYNYINVSGTRTLVAELGWDANIEGSVTGYEVDKGATVVCSSSLSISCIDFSPASSGSTTYTVKTLYTDGAGNPGSVSTNYSVTAPTSPQPAFVSFIGNASCGTTSMTITVPSGGVAAGNRVVVTLETRGGTSGAVTATDSRSNAYGSDVDFTNIDQRLVILSANAGTALATGDTIRVNYPSATSAMVTAAAFANMATTSPVDASGTGAGSGSGPSASVTTTNANDLLFGAVSIANSLSATQPSSWVGSYFQAGCGGGSNGNSTNVGAYRQPTSTGAFTYNPTMNSSGRWAAGVVAYKPGSTTTLQQPGPPSGLSASNGTGGTTVLTWTAPTTTPAPDFYRIYRDGQDYTNRIDSTGATGSTVTWTDTNTGGNAHSYWVTTVSANLTESAFAGPVTL
jgi:type II secretory pathway pseudopilin PulG